MGSARRAGLLAATLVSALLLSDCATHPSTPAPPVRNWAQRQSLLLSEAGNFTLSGRLGATHGSEGISAGIHWRQQGANAQVSLSGPLGLGGASVSLQGDAVSIRTSDGRRLVGEAAVAELTRQLGFDPPLQSLRFWVIGVPDPADAAGRAAPVLDDQQRLSHLMQDGWVIAYDAYTSVQRQWLPRRLTVSRDDLRLRLVIDDWQL